MKNLLFDIPYLWSAFIGWSIFAATLYIDHITDYALWLRNRNVVKPKGSVNHFRGSLWRVAGLTPAFICIGLHGLAAMIFIYWFVFDSWMGVKIAGKPEYMGTTPKIDSIRKRGLKTFWYIKMALAIASLSYYIIKIVS